MTNARYSLNLVNRMLPFNLKDNSSPLTEGIASILDQNQSHSFSVEISDSSKQHITLPNFAYGDFIIGITSQSASTSKTVKDIEGKFVVYRYFSDGTSALCVGSSISNACKGDGNLLNLKSFLVNKHKIIINNVDGNVSISMCNESETNQECSPIITNYKSSPYAYIWIGYNVPEKMELFVDISDYE